MNLSPKIFYLLLFFSTAACAQKKTADPKVETGVSLELATQRAGMIRQIQYQLDFDIPSDKNLPIDARAEINFKLNEVPNTLQLDFKQDAAHVKSISSNSLNVPVLLEQEHLLIARKFLQPGLNKISIQFTAGNESLNRNEDFLYALFVPDHARTVFPCFDQPDLKARFLLSLTVPSAWKVLANADVQDSVQQGKATQYHFKNSDQLPTYLFSFTAGKYSIVQQTRAERPMTFLHRETDSTKIKLSTDSIFKAHADAIHFLEQWTGIPFPFQKVGFVAIPDFQFGGMEHPGEVQYKSSSLFLDDAATKDQLISRSNLISHETAHMWFGDLVTMKWFNDVWMKEVFANFMADKVTEKLMGKSTFDLKFLQDHYPAAYGVDRTQGANPIRQQLDNLNDAGSMYGNIIYHKAPIMMRQLELLMGAENFQKGIREYLKKYAYTNATWNDLISILSKYSSSDLYKWNLVWVNQPGRPLFSSDITYTGNKIKTFKLVQKPESGTPRIWPQVFNITLVYPDHKKTIAVNMNARQVDLKETEGLAKPEDVIFNSDGAGYGVFPMGVSTLKNAFTLKNPLERASTYINAYENMLSGDAFKPLELLNLFAKGIEQESNEMNLRLLTGYLSSMYWTFISSNERQSISITLEQALWRAMEKQTLPNPKKILFGTYQNIYLSETAGKQMYAIWQKQQAPTGVKLIEDDYTSMALAIALRSDSGNVVLATQLARIKNIDRKNRLTFIIPALSADVKVRDHFFSTLSDRKNRQKEAWVTTALSYLHHPLRQSTSIHYLPESLNLLEDIKKTGDIFFPQSWLSAIFGNYQSKAAYQVVQDFLKAHPDYNPKLKDKILQSTDNLYRAQSLISGN